MALNLDVAFLLSVSIHVILFVENHGCKGSDLIHFGFKW